MVNWQVQCPEYNTVDYVLGDRINLLRSCITSVYEVNCGEELFLRT